MSSSDGEAARHDTPEGSSGPSAPATEKNSNDGSEGGASTPLENAAPPASGTIRDEIQRLLDEQRRVRQDRKRVAADLKNAQRRQKRLKHRARLLSTEELGRVLALRDQEEAAKAAKKQNAEAKHGSPAASTAQWSEHTT